MVEGGPTLAAAFIAADLVDEAVLFHSDKVVGADGIEALDAAALAMLKQRLKLVGDRSRRRRPARDLRTQQVSDVYRHCQ